MAAVRRTVTGLAATALVATVAAAPASATAATCATGWGSLPKAATGTASPISNATTGSHACYDRFVVTLGATAAGYDVRYVANVYTEGSGVVIPLAGGAKLQVVVRAPAAASYRAQVGARLPGVNLVGYRTFRDAKYGGSFEGYTTFGIGTRARLPFRVFKLGTPGRIVVDVAHQW
jgi:hypothetical protein